MTPCPTCKKPIDALRAPVAGVRDGKIVGYCSVACEIRARGQAPVIEASESQRLQRRRRDSIESKQAWEWLDDEPAAPAHVAIGGGRTVKLALLGVAIAAVAGVALYVLL